MTSVKKTMVKQLTPLSLILQTMEMLIMAMQTMETANQVKLKEPKVNRTSLQQRTSLTAQHQQLMDSRS